MPNGPETHLPSNPTRRPLKVFAFDPSRGRLLGNEIQIDVRYRQLPPGTTDRSNARSAIPALRSDWTGHRHCPPVKLDQPGVLVRNGLAPSQSDPRFHQQMVYAVVSDTIEQFETALGRRIHWRRGERRPKAPRGWVADDILTLMLYPHA